VRRLPFAASVRVVIYEFQDEQSGEVIEIDFPMRDCPDIGDKVRRGGKTYVRIFTTNVQVGVPCDGSSYPKVSKTLPQFATGADYVKDPGSDYGCPIIESRTQQDELCRRHGYTREYHHTDADHSQNARGEKLNDSLNPQFGKASATTP